MHRDCAHEVPSGATVESGKGVTVNGTLVAPFEQCQHPIYKRPPPYPEGARTPSELPVAVTRAWSNGGVIEKAVANAPSGHQWASLSNTFVVPRGPETTANNRQTVLWPAIYSPGAESLVQPVLQCGFNGQVA